MSKIQIVVGIIVAFLVLVVFPWNCRRSAHYNWAYRGRVENQIRESKVIKDLQERVAALEKVAESK